MSYSTPDLFNQPEQFDLTIVGVLDDPEGCYSFDDLVVWQHADGRLFYGEDAGCSCPCPFEDFTSLETAEPITKDTWAAFAKAVEDHCTEYRKHRDGWVDPQAADKTELLAKVSRLLGA